VSKASAAKKARRKKRVSTRNDRWMPPEVHADLAAVTELDELLTRRGWEYDEEFSGDEFVTWVYPPSAAEFDDFFRRAQPHAAGWIGFYWGRTPEECRRSNEMPDAFMLGWLEWFQKNHPAPSPKPRL